MRNKFLQAGIPLTVLAIASAVVLTARTGETGSVYKPRTQKSDLHTGDFNGAAELYKMLRKNINTGEIEAADWKAAKQATLAQIAAQEGRAANMTWIEDGPDNVGGRTRAICIDRTDNNIVYAGSVSGGLWKSINQGNTWTQLTAFDQSFAISSMCQDGNGKLYVGTGCSFENGFSSLSSGMPTADGLYVSEDGGATFTKITGISSGLDVNELQTNPLDPNKIWAGTSGGLKIITHNAGTYTVSNAPSATSSIKDVKVSPDGNVVICCSGTTTYVSDNGGTSFTSVTGTSASNLIPAISPRVEYAISFEKNADNNKYNIYASCSKGSLYEAYLSRDNGFTWYQVQASSAAFNPVGTQGNYNHTAAGIPGYPEQFTFGGIDVYKFNTDYPTNGTSGQFYTKSFWFLNSPNPNYVHADNHEMEWDKVTNQIYIGNDGGIFKSSDRSLNIFYSANYGYNVTQFYSVGFSGYGDVIGGTQDNGTNYNNHTNASYLSFDEVMGGDGFDCDISSINPDIVFASIYYGGIQRSNDNGGTFTDFYEQSILDLGTPGEIGSGLGMFSSVGRLYENMDDTESLDSIRVAIPQGDTLNPGDTIYYLSRTSSVQLWSLATTTLIGGVDTVTLQDPIQSLYAVGFTGADKGLWITRQALRFNEDPNWDSIPLSLSTSEGITCIEFSADGHYLYCGTTAGKVFRVSGLEYYYSGTGGYNIDSLEFQLIHQSTSYIAGIAVDPQDPEHIVICLGNYGLSSNVMESTTAASTTTTTSFSNIDSNLPSMPVYDAVIDRSNPNIIILGTEMGVWTTSNGGTSWQFESGGVSGGNGPGIVPVFAVRQQWRPWTAGYVYNPGVVYIGTHGRGIWHSETLLGTAPFAEGTGKTGKNNLNIYPNPAVDNTTIEFTAKENANSADIIILNLEGKVVSQLSQNGIQKGKNRIQIPVNELIPGTYVVSVGTGKERFTNKLIVSK